MAQSNHSKANDTQQEQRVPKKPETFHVVKTDEQKHVPGPTPEIKLAGNLAFQETWIAQPSAERPVLELVPAPETKELSEKQIIDRARKLDDDLAVDLLREHIRKGDTEKQWFTRIRIAAEQELRDSKTITRFKIIRDRKDCHDPDEELMQELFQLRQSEEPSDAAKERIKTLKIILHDALVSRSKVIIVGLKPPTEEESIQAVFKPKDGEPIWTERDGTTRGLLENRPQGGYLREWLAGYVAKAIGSHVVPPTVIREINGSIGSVQGWVEGKQASYYNENTGISWTEKAKEIDLQELAILDYLLHNVDRHDNNFFIEDDGSVKGIDHGAILPTPNRKNVLRSFPLRCFGGTRAELLPDLRERLAQTFNNGDREDLIRQSFSFVFGEKDGNIMFDQLIERVNELTGSGQFPDYKMRESDEMLFTKIIGNAQTAIERKPKK